MMQKRDDQRERLQKARNNRLGCHIKGVNLDRLTPQSIQIKVHYYHAGTYSGCG